MSKDQRQGEWATVKVGDKLKRRSRLHPWVRTVTKITPTGKMRLDDGTLVEQNGRTHLSGEVFPIIWDLFIGDE